MKTFKYVLGVLILLSSFAAFAESSVGAGLSSIILGLVILPPISDKLKEKFSFWQKKPVRYVSYVALLAIIGATAPDMDNIGSGSSSESDISKTPYEKYLSQSEKDISALSDVTKKNRDTTITNLKKNSIYKELVDKKTVSKDYLLILHAVSQLLSNQYDEGKSSNLSMDIDDKMQAIPDSRDFVLNVFVLEGEGGLTRELVEVMDRYQKQYGYYGEGGIVADKNGVTDKKIAPYDLTPIFVMLDPNTENKKLLDAIYEARQKGISSWNIPENQYSYLLRKDRYNSYLKEKYPDSPYYIDIDIETTPQEICGEYEDNEVSADNKYKGKKVAITGTIERIIKSGFSDDPIIVFKGTFIKDVKFYFSKDSNNEISNLSKGDKITIVGTCKGMTLVDVVLHKCKILE